MSAPGLMSAIRQEAFANLQINAGAFIANFDVYAAVDAESLRALVKALVLANDPTVLGMTSGGGTFTATRELRKAEVDGLRYPFKGDSFVDSMDANITSTQVEIISANIARLISADVTASGRKTMINIKTAIRPEIDYLNNLCWVGDLNGGGLVVIELDNALNTEDFSFTFADKAEGKLTFGFHAHQSTVTAYDEAPFRVIFFDSGADRSEAGGEAGAVLKIEEARPNTVLSGLKITYDAKRNGSGTPSSENQRKFAPHIGPFKRCLMISGRNMAGHVRFNGRTDPDIMAGRMYPAGTYYVSFVYHNPGEFKAFKLQFGGFTQTFDTEPEDGLVTVQSAVASVDFMNVVFVNADYALRNDPVEGISDVFLTLADVASDYGTDYEAPDVTVYDFAKIPQFVEAQDDSTTGVLYDGEVDLFAGKLTKNALVIDEYAESDAAKIDAADHWLSSTAPNGTTGYPDVGSQVLYYPAAPVISKITNTLGVIRTAKSAVTIAWVPNDDAASISVQYVEESE